MKFIQFLENTIGVASILVISLMIPSIAFASLYNWYAEQGEQLPTVSQRVGVAKQCGIDGYTGTKDQNIALELCLIGNLASTEGTLGSTLPVAGMTYSLAGSGVTASQTSIILSSLTIPQTGYELQDSDFSSTFYVTLEPGNTKRQEILQCTTVTQNVNNSATLSGCTRGLLPFTPFTASNTYRFSHAGGTAVIFSDPPQLFNEYTAKGNNELITGQWQFTQLPTSTTSTPTDPGQFITLYQFSQATTTGGINGTTTAKGVYQAATDAQLQAGTVYGSTGAALVATGQSHNQTSTPNKAPVANGEGKIDKSWIPTSSAMTWTAQQDFRTTTHSSSTISNLNVSTLQIGSTSTAALVNAGNANALHVHNPLVLSSTTLQTVAMASQNVGYYITANGVGTFTSGANDVYHIKAITQQTCNAGFGTTTVQIGNNVVTSSFMALTYDINSHISNMDIYLVNRNSASSQYYLTTTSTFSSISGLTHLMSNSGGTVDVDISNGFNVRFGFKCTGDTNQTGSLQFLTVEKKNN